MPELIPNKKFISDLEGFRQQKTILKKIAKAVNFLENAPTHPGLRIERIINDAKSLENQWFRAPTPGELNRIMFTESCPSSDSLDQMFLSSISLSNPRPKRRNHQRSSVAG